MDKKTKSKLILLSVLIVVYVFLKVFVAHTGSEKDDYVPDALLKAIPMFMAADTTASA